jgi:tetraacyldisaccharide 4'-kinase
MIRKPKFWEENNLSILSILFLPFTIPFRVNNFFFDYYQKFKTKKIFSICVGNIYIGGTGKTPMTIKLFNIIKKINKKTVTAKKFYRSHNDEIILLKKKTKFITGTNRIQIVKKAIKNKDKIIIFDDGLQDKKIDYHLKFACFNSSNWIGNGHIIPSGPLRESLAGLKRVDAIFLKNIDKPNQNIKGLIKKINPKIKIFDTSYKINNLKKFNLKNKYIIFSGIGNPESFEILLKKNKFKIIKYFKYPDHYEYNKNDILKIINMANLQQAQILTTEKDYVKLSKVFKKKINFIDIELSIAKERKLIQFLKLKMNE